LPNYAALQIASATPSIQDNLEGYTVTYPDGYSTWMRRNAFLGMYSEIPDGVTDIPLAGELAMLIGRLATLTKWRESITYITYTPEYRALYEVRVEALIRYTKALQALMAA